MESLICLYLRWTLGLIWLWAGAMKLRSLEVNKATIENLILVRGNVAGLLARFLPILEIVLGLCFLIGFFVKIASVISLFLLVSFTIAMLRIIALKRTIACNCFGQNNNEFISWSSIFRNLVFVIGAGVCFLVECDYSSIRNLVTTPNSLREASGYEFLVPLAVFWLGAIMLIVTALSFMKIVKRILTSEASPADYLIEIRKMNQLLNYIGKANFKRKAK